LPEAGRRSGIDHQEGRTIIEVDEHPTGDEPAAPARASLTPRERRARRRRRRRILGVLVFVAVAGGIIGVAYLAVAGPDDSDQADQSTTSSGPPTTTVAKPAGPYRVTTGVNVRQGPGLNFATVGAIETGHSVFVSCVTEGASVDGVTKWLRTTGFGPVGFLTVRYVDTGDDLNIAGKIPDCAT
jgi:hypothetical protein